jgi:hypothetical protein
MLPYKRHPLGTPLTTTHTVMVAAGLDLNQALGPGTIIKLIPVVTFLAPLASNFEGLKDR